MFLWIDPPDENPGWIHTLDGEVTLERVQQAIAGYQGFPDDNDARMVASMTAPAGTARDWWGVTLMDALPDDLPAGVIMVDTPEERN